jgi:hypothetical protein
MKASSISASQSFYNAINTTKNELKNPIKLEFEKMSDELILEEASQSSNSKEFKLMMDIVRISKDTVASLSGIFDLIE